MGWQCLQRPHSSSAHQMPFLGPASFPYLMDHLLAGTEREKAGKVQDVGQSRSLGHLPACSPSFCLIPPPPASNHVFPHSCSFSPILSCANSFTLGGAKTRREEGEKGVPGAFRDF